MSCEITNWFLFLGILESIYLLSRGKSGPTEEKWGKWCELEYCHMRQIVGDKEGEEYSNAGKKDELWFTNVTSDQRDNFERSLWADLKLDSKKARAVLHTASLEQIQQGKCADVKMDWKNVCLLDMEATEELELREFANFGNLRIRHFV